MEDREPRQINGLPAGEFPPDPEYGTVAAKLPFDMLRRTRNLADKQHRSVSNLIKHLLLQEMEKEGLGGE